RLHVPFQRSFCLFPVIRQELMIFSYAEGGGRLSLHLEKPAACIVVQVDCRGILENLFVETGERTSDRRKQVGNGFGGLYVANRLQEPERIPWIDLPVQEVHVLHQTHGIRSKPETESTVRLSTPHVVASVAKFTRQEGGKLAHEERQVL